MSLPLIQGGSCEFPIMKFWDYGLVWWTKGVPGCRPIPTLHFEVVKKGGPKVSFCETTKVYTEHQEFHFIWPVGYDFSQTAWWHTGDTMSGHDVLNIAAD